MIPLSRYDSGGFPHLWWKRFVTTCKRCWMWAPYNPVRVSWCNVVVLVRKKDGGLHFCIDFHHLNAHTKKDSYPLLRIQEALESLVGAGYFSCLDLKSGFWQIKMKKASKQYTTFTHGSLGFFECDCMSFALCNALATFQRLMQNCPSVLNLIYYLIYQDDIVVFSQTAEEHLHQLQVVFDQFREYNLKLKPPKYSFFKEEINYLCTIRFPRKVYNPVTWAWRQSWNVHCPKHTQRFMPVLSLVGHYWQFLKGFAHIIVQLLNEHLTGEGASRKSGAGLTVGGHLGSLQSTKKGLYDCPHLGFCTDYTKPFLLETDASKDG